jgi:HPt (histidine-containing phosphotransfer) domain-containing protein
VKGVIDRCLETGMNDYVPKPFTPEVLVQKILRYVKRDAKGSVVTRTVANTHSQEDEKHYDLGQLEKILQGDREQINKMLIKFLEVSPVYMKELTDAFSKLDYAQVSDAAHKLKSSLDLLANRNIRSNIRLILEYSRTGTNLEKLPLLFEKLNQFFPEMIKELKAEVKLS